MKKRTSLFESTIGLIAIVALTSCTRTYHTQTYRVVYLETPTPYPTRNKSPRIMTPPSVINSNEIVVIPNLDKSTYSTRDEILIRFHVSNYSPHGIGIWDTWNSFAKLSLRLQNGTPISPSGPLHPPEPYLRMPVRGLNSGATFVTPWYSLSYWGYVSLKAGSYVLVFRPKAHLSNATIVPQPDGSTAVSSTRELTFTIQ